MRGPFTRLGAALALCSIGCQGPDRASLSPAGQALLEPRVTELRAPGSSAAGDSGTAWLWGANLGGQLGRPAPNHARPQPLESLPGVVGISGGLLHTLLLLEDGSVWAFGENADGQLGWSDALPSRTPRKVPGLSGITAIAAGGFHSLAFNATDGSLWAWGNNSSGQLGLVPSSAPVRTPTRVPITQSLVAIAAGGNHTLALDVSGQVWTFGANNYGQLGDGTTDDSEVPKPVPLPKITAFCAGLYHSLAVDELGSVRAWGWNPFGQLGYGVQNGWTEPVTVPVQAVGLPKMTAVSCGQLHSLGLSAAGQVFAWGYNSSGQIGDGSILPANTGRLSPARLSPSGIVSIAAGGMHSLALEQDGTLWAWGSNVYGAVGNSEKPDARVPVRVARLSGVTAIAGGGEHSLALAPARGPLSLVAAGRNESGQLGSGDTRDQSDAVAARHPPGVLDLAAGEAHSLSLGTDYLVRAWGSNAQGQLGVPGADRMEPVVVPVPLEAGQGVSAVAAGREHSLALRSDGSVWVWGQNSFGQLGNGTTTSSTSPVRVPIDGVSAISAAFGHSLALRSDGSVWGWGENSCRQLGRDPRGLSMSLVPLKIESVSGAVAIATGACHSLALEFRGTIRAWGSNDRAQLGDGNAGYQSKVVTVVGVDDAVAIASGGYHSLAIVSGGRVISWGDAAEGQLGNGSSYSYWEKRPIDGLSQIDVIAAGTFHSLAANIEGAGWAWGSDGFGQLGAGGLDRSFLPEPINSSEIELLAGGNLHTLLGLR